MKKTPFFPIVLTVAAVLMLGTLIAAGYISSSPDHIPRIGYTGSPMLSAIYTAQDTGAFEKPGFSAAVREFDSTNEIGFALIGGRLDAGFVRSDDALHLLTADTSNQLRIAGAVTFPYGASLVVRKDLNLRINDLEGKTLAIEDEDCALVKQFRHDAARYGVNTSNITYVYLSFDDMLPALEAGTVDGAVLTTNLALIAESKGHKTLYQNWEIKEKDECCPTYLQNIQYFLIVRGVDRDGVENILRVFEVQNRVSGNDRIASVTRHSGFPETLLSRYPAATFLRADNFEQTTKAELGAWLWK